MAAPMRVYSWGLIPLMMKYKLIIFDWDGTLMDSENKIVRCFQMACHDIHLSPPSREDIKEIIGLDLVTSIQRLVPNIKLEQRDQVIRRYREHFLHLDNTVMEFFPNVLRGLDQLKAWGYQLAVATGKARRGLDRLLQHSRLHELFTVTRCADESCSKPDPQMLFDILDQVRLPVGQSVMVGDTIFDMEMAQRANMDRLAMAYGVHDAHRLLNFQPLSCFDNFAQLMDWFAPEN